MLFNVTLYCYSLLFTFAVYFIFQVILFNVLLYYYSLLFIHYNRFYCSKLFDLMLIHIIAHYYCSLFYSSFQVNLFDVLYIIIIIIITTTTTTIIKILFM